MLQDIAILTGAEVISEDLGLKLNETSIFNFNNIDDENDKNSNIHNFERGKRKTLTLIEKMKFGDTLFKDEVSLKLSNKTLIDETEGISLKKYKVISKIGKTG